MFDYEHERRIRLGQNPDAGLLATFRYEFDSESQTNVPYINIFLSKNAQVDRPATEDDFKRFPDRWKAFQENEDRPPDGLPINQVPFATPANISACKSERIYTAEQLVETPDSRLQRNGLLNFKYQCSDLIKQLKDSNHAIEMREEIEHLKSQLAAVLESNQALKDQIREEQEPKPRRGRPRKSSGNDTSDSQSSPA